jgi:hypothetical protein
MEWLGVDVGAAMEYFSVASVFVEDTIRVVESTDPNVILLGGVGKWRL